MSAATRTRPDDATTPRMAARDVGDVRPLGPVRAVVPTQAVGRA